MELVQFSVLPLSTYLCPRQLNSFLPSIVFSKSVNSSRILRMVVREKNAGTKTLDLSGNKQPWQLLCRRHCWICDKLVNNDLAPWKKYRREIVLERLFLYFSIRFESFESLRSRFNFVRDWLKPSQRPHNLNFDWGKIFYYQRFSLTDFCWLFTALYGVLRRWNERNRNMKFSN